ERRSLSCGKSWQERKNEGRNEKKTKGAKHEASGSGEIEGASYHLSRRVWLRLLILLVSIYRIISIAVWLISPKPIGLYTGKVGGGGRNGTTRLYWRTSGPFIDRSERWECEQRAGRASGKARRHAVSDAGTHGRKSFVYRARRVSPGASGTPRGRGYQA